MKKVLVLVLALALLCSSALAAEIGFLPPAMTSPFYASCIEGATPVAEANGYDLLVMSPPTEDDYATQMSMMEDMITRGVAGIADIEALGQVAGCIEGVIAGRAVYEGALAVADGVRACDEATRIAEAAAVAANPCGL